MQLEFFFSILKTRNFLHGIYVTWHLLNHTHRLNYFVNLPLEKFFFVGEKKRKNKRKISMHIYKGIFIRLVKLHEHGELIYEFHFLLASESKLIKFQLRLKAIFCSNRNALVRTHSRWERMEERRRKKNSASKTHHTGCRFWLNLLPLLTGNRPRTIEREQIPSQYSDILAKREQ